ncbi:MAG: hypothetical protein ACFE8G_03790 [Candidatus Hermodarchaeota archaeon]
MVIVIMRLIQKIANGKWDELEELDKKYTELENNLGYPPKKRFRSLTGAYDNNVIIIEREWQSLSKMEKIMTKGFLDPEITKLDKKLDSIIEWQKTELYVPHPPFPE